MLTLHLYTSSSVRVCFINNVNLYYFIVEMYYFLSPSSCVFCFLFFVFVFVFFVFERSFVFLIFAIKKNIEMYTTSMEAAPHRLKNYCASTQTANLLLFDTCHPLTRRTHFTFLCHCFGQCNVSFPFIFQHFQVLAIQVTSQSSLN